MAANEVGMPGQGKGRADYIPPVVLFQSQPWHKAYMEALFESDRARIGERIRYAEQLIVLRERELFAETDPVEQRAVIGALRALQALRVCLHL